ncbi:MAG: DUF2203 domain-containing protein [Phycisphaeraceae bacterium]
MQSTTHRDSPTTVSRKTFCVDEANRALPFISRVISDIVDLHEQIVLCRRTLERIEMGLHGGEATAYEAEYRRSMNRLRELVRELDLVGVDLLDFERGLISFPTIHDGREAALSWQLGEQEVEYWHEPEAGVEAREPIATLRP